MLDVQMYYLSFVQIMHRFQKLPSKMLNLSIGEDRVVPSLLEIEQGSSIILLHKNKNKEFTRRKQIFGASETFEQVRVVKILHDGYFLQNAVFLSLCDGLNLADHVPTLRGRIYFYFVLFAYFALIDSSESTLSY